MMMSVSSPRQSTWLTDSDFCAIHDDEHDDADNNDHNNGAAIDVESGDDYLYLLMMDEDDMSSCSSWSFVLPCLPFPHDRLLSSLSWNPTNLIAPDTRHNLRLSVPWALPPVLWFALSVALLDVLLM